MTLLEWAATLLGLACVALAAARSVLTFPAAIASVTLVGSLVWRERLYSDAALQLFFVGANIYGWRNWVRARGAGTEVPVGPMPRERRGRWAAWSLLAALVWGGGMDALTDASFPWWDAGIAVASIAAQIMMARRWIENWIVWIAVDLASVPLYLAKGLDLLALLYLVYLALAAWGWRDWRAAHLQSCPPAPGVSPA